MEYNTLRKIGLWPLIFPYANSNIKMVNLKRIIKSKLLKTEKTLEMTVGKLLSERKKTISIAESCTGGFLSNRITSVTGSSKYFKMAIVAYSNESKTFLLKVPQEIIKKFGAVSKEVAQEMAQTIKSIAKTDIGVGITGIAGPTGATKTKPIGLVFIGLATPKKTICKEFNFVGDRETIKLQASQSALDMVRRYLIKLKSKNQNAK